MNRIRVAEIETLPRAGMEAIQLRRLQLLVARVYERVRPYREKMDRAGIKPSDIRSLEDLRKLPFTTKDDLRDNYPFGLFTMPLEQVVRVHASSGTTGKPTVVGYSAEDINTWAEVMARCLAMGGVTSGDMVQNAYGYGLFTGRRQHQAPDHHHAGLRLHRAPVNPLLCAQSR